MNDDMQILGWDDEVEEGSPFVLLPEGNYPSQLQDLKKVFMRSRTTVKVRSC